MLNKKILIKERVKRTVEVLISTKFKNSVKSIPQTDVLFYCYDSNRGINLNGKAYSPLIDSLKDEFENEGLKCITIAAPLSKIIDDKGYGSPIPINMSFLIAYGLSLIFKNRKYNPLVSFYERVFKRADPKFIITIGCNDSLCKAARNLGIFHAELLHGIGYNPIPWGWDKKPISCLPQCVLTLDPVSTKTFSELSNKNVITKEIIHPFLKRFNQHNINSLPIEWLPSSEKNTFKKEILISLQWGYCYELDGVEHYKDIVDNGLFPKELEEVIKHTQSDVLWRFRLHPVLFRKAIKYKKLLAYIEEFVQLHPNCELEDSTYLPLPSILSLCSGHITLSSMVSYEAAYIGVPTLALSPLLRDEGSSYFNMFNDLVESGYLLKAEPNSTFIKEWVKSSNKMAPLLNFETTQTQSDELLEWLTQISNKQ